MTSFVRKVSVLFIFNFILTGIFAQDNFQINKEYLVNRLKVLTSDDLLGRKVFSEGIEKAADIIADDFKDTGLDYMPELSSYKQEFKMYNSSIEEFNVDLEGESIDDKNKFGLIKQNNINWTNETGIEIITINNNKNFRDEFAKIKATDKNSMVLVHKSHEKIFKRYQQYFSKGGISFEKELGSSFVFVLTPIIAPSKFSVIIENKYEEKSLKNIVGIIEGNRKDEIVLFSGHYDHIGILKEIEGDSIANGANDDASGTVAVMALAKYFKGKGKPERTIYFVAFTAEEVGGYGSQYFSKQLDPDKIVAMFNIEMIGKPAVEGPNTAWITGFEKSNFGELLQKSVEGTKYKFYADPYPKQNLFYRSDNATLARLGVPAHSISTTPIDVDKDYHQVTDEFETINIQHMNNTIKAIAKAAEGIIAGKDTPTRVDKSKVD